MKSDIEIKDDIYAYLKASLLMQEVSGKLYKRPRPVRSRKEDVVISVLSNLNGQIQQAYVNVNIYVADIEDNYGEFISDDSRLRVLCSIASKLLSSHHGGEWYFVLESQKVETVKATNEHVINNRLYYKQNNN